MTHGMNYEPNFRIIRNAHIVCCIWIIVNVNSNKLSMRTISDYFNIKIWLLFMYHSTKLPTIFSNNLFSTLWILGFESNQFCFSLKLRVSTGFGLARNYFVWHLVSLNTTNLGKCLRREQLSYRRKHIPLSF